MLEKVICHMSITIQVEQELSLVQDNLVQDNDGYLGYFKGSIDDVRVYNRALKESEVLDLYKLGKH